MKERGILFSAPMVRALLDGSKTQTRRPLKVQPWSVSSVASGNHIFDFRADKADLEKIVDMAHLVGCSPFGRPDDRLWVRETWQTHVDKDGIAPRDLPKDSHVQYPATYDGWVSKKRPSMFMPRWASRIALEIVGMRVECLQDISETDAVAEGIRISNKERRSDACYGIYECSMPDGKTHFNDSAYNLYRTLWQQINGPGSWDANPWVWVVEFKKATP